MDAVSNAGAMIVPRAVEIEADAIAEAEIVATDLAPLNKDAANRDVRNSHAENRAVANKVAAAMIARPRAHAPRNQFPPMRARSSKPNHVLLSPALPKREAKNRAALIHAVLIHAVADVIAAVVRADRAIHSEKPHAIRAGRWANAMNRVRRCRILRARPRRVVTATTKMMIWTICERRFVRPIALASQLSIRAKRPASFGMTKFHPRVATLTCLGLSMRKSAAHRLSNAMTS